MATLSERLKASAEHSHIMAKYKRPSAGLKAMARLYRNLGDIEVADAYDRQAEIEQEYEENYTW